MVDKRKQANPKHLVLLIKKDATIAALAASTTDTIVAPTK